MGISKLITPDISAILRTAWANLYVLNRPI